MDYSYLDYFDTYGGLFAGSIILIFIIGIIAIAITVLEIVGLWKVFKKAGKNGWEAIVPIYNVWVLIEISGLNWWWFLIAIADSIVLTLDLDDLIWIANLASLFAMFNAYYNVSKRFNKGIGFSVCLTLFSPICLPILGLSKDNVYNDAISVSRNGFIDSNNSFNKGHDDDGDNANKENDKISFCGNCGTKLDKDSKFCPRCGNQKK